MQPRHLVVSERCNHLLAMVQEVMGQIIADIPKNTATENSSCRMPIPIDDCMSKLVERGCQDHEESRWHHQAQLVHGQIVMDTMQ